MATPARSLDSPAPDGARRPARRGAAQTVAASGLAVVSQSDAASALLNPLRRNILQALAAPGSATTVADAIGSPRQLVNYHLRVLEKAGLVEEVGTRQRRGLTERLVRATAAHYLVSPDAIAELGGSTTDVSDRFSATYQVAVAARTIREVAALAAMARDAGKRLTTLSLDTEISFATPAARAAFGDELVATINRLVAKYHDGTATHGRTYRLFAGAHPVFRSTDAPGLKTRPPKDGIPRTSARRRS
ncbi:MAG TPA: helix-turn-helix domain-containing protein [Vicinamibacterales bacterium]|nr:helix-turn-helix domain-containing protein [Vicinamibacterales bacterium]